jgi:hypothetical protein
VLTELEGEAAWLLREFDLRKPPGAKAIVQRHLGAGAVRVASIVGADAKLCPDVHGRTLIFVRPRLSPESFRWAVLHELAEWHLQRVGYRSEDVEQAAELLTAALVVPRESYRGALRVHGEAWEQLALGFATTQTCIALRHGEITGEPLAVVAPATVRVRGQEWAWPPEPELRRLARATRPGLRRGVLTDDRRRIVLLAENAD